MAMGSSKPVKTASASNTLEDIPKTTTLSFFFFAVLN